MLPLLGKIGSMPLHTYGVMLALGFLFGLLINRFLARRNGIDPDDMVDATFWGMIAGVVGSRIVYIITMPGEYLADPMAVFRVWEGGLVFWGGPIGTIVWSFWYLPRKKLPYWKFTDCAIHGLVVGQIFGRFGCLGAGCCYGRPTHSDWGIRLTTDLVDVAHRGVLLHPVQLYDSISMSILLVGMLTIFFKYKKFDGQVFLTYLMAYPVIRSILETFRGDISRGFVIEGWVSTSQFISAVVFVVAIFVLRARLKATANEAVPGASPA